MNIRQHAFLRPVVAALVLSLWAGLRPCASGASLFAAERQAKPAAGPQAADRPTFSDVTAAEESELAGSAVDFLGLPDLELEDEDEQVPAGDLDLLGDLGMSAMEMGLLLDDVDLYPDELLSDVARRLGFGELFDDAVGLTSA